MRLSQIEAAKAFSVRGLRALAGFASKLKVTFNDIEVGIDYDPEPGLADNGDLEHDLQVMFEQVGLAIEKPLHDEEVGITPEALSQILHITQGYAYFLQQWGSHTWRAATATPIDVRAVTAASVTALAAMDESFFRVRFDRLTPKEKKYLRAMAELGEGPHRSGDIAACYDANVSSLAPTRSSLIAKGMVWSPNHGDTAFTVPMFDAFMKRTITGNDWR